jgi:putative DNA primase/helicase
MTPRDELAALKERLESDAERITVALLGEPTAKGRRSWRWGNRGSLSYDFGRHLWHSFETQEGGDVFDLIRFANSGWDFSRALQWARDWAGGGAGAAAVRPHRQLARFKAHSTDWAVNLWREAKPARDTPVETYLASRGLKLPDRSEHALRFHPACPRGEGRLPAMLGLMSGIVTGRMLGVHRTFLSADGRAKANLEPNKMMLGRAKGAVLKLSPDEDVTLGLALTEGIEDGLAVLNDGFAPVWACLSAGTLMNFPVLGGIGALTLCADNDTPGRQAAEACAARWRAAGKEVHVRAPPQQHKDYGAMAEIEGKGAQHG